MPIPVITDHVSAQVVLKGKSGNPEDVYVNTFYFRNDTSTGTFAQFADIIADDLAEFYTVQSLGGVSPMSIASGLSSATLENEMEIRVYDLGQPAPRFPEQRFRPLTGLGSGALPSEVAACLSYVADRNQPRHRGRIYLGPLSTSVSVVTAGRPQLSVNWTEAVLRNYNRLLASTSHQPVLWSPTDGVTKEITGAWMDNAFDTQRRRGEKATGRQTVGLYLGQSGTLLTPV